MEKSFSEAHGDVLWRQRRLQVGLKLYIDLLSCATGLISQSCMLDPGQQVGEGKFAKELMIGVVYKVRVMYVDTPGLARSVIHIR